jgi:periplasmic protein TonB
MRNLVSYAAIALVFGMMAAPQYAGAAKGNKVVKPVPPPPPPSPPPKEDEPFKKVKTCCDPPSSPPPPPELDVPS